MIEIASEVPTAARHTGRGEPLWEDEPLTLSDVFTKAAAKYDLPNALSYKHEGTWKSISSRELIYRAKRIAAALHSLGLRKGDRAAILAVNSPWWTIVDAGCQFAGIVDVPIYTTLSTSAVGYILNDSSARVLFLDDNESYERVKQALPTSVRHIVLFKGGPDKNDLMTLDQLENQGAAQLETELSLIEKLSAEVSTADVATLIYTSGTTGEPKGVMLTHTNIISNLIDAAEKYSFSGQDVSLSVLPLSHIFERTGMYLYIFFGMMVHYAESIEKVPDDLQEIKPTLFIGVPRIFEKVYSRAKLNAARSNRFRETVFDWAMEIAKRVALQKENGEACSPFLFVKHAIADIIVYRKLREFFGGNLRYCITGGAALADDIDLMFRGAGIPIMQGYGLTETSPVISSNNPSASRVGTVGRPIRNVKVRIAEDGEIEVAGPGVMIGYYNKEEATRDAFTRDGWFKTGDIGTIDDDGFLKITDRKKELFKTSGGKYIAPAQIEQMIRASRFVSQAVLVGNGRRFPAALIVPNFEQLASYAKIKGLKIVSQSDYCSHPKILDLFKRQIDSMTEELSQYEKVKRFALLENELTIESGELTPTLKVKRRVIDEKYKDIIERLYIEAEKEKPGN